MRIAIFGLGYVGTTLSLCLAQDGHEILGYDISKEKVETLRRGKLHLFEPELQEILEKKKKHLIFNSQPRDEFKDVDIVFLCVGTPTRPEGEVVLEQVKHAISELKPFRSTLEKSTIVLRSTVPPGTTEKNLLEDFKRSQVFYIPEFLREGSAVKDYQMSDCVVGVSDIKACEDLYLSKLQCLPNFSKAKFVHYKSAELLKYMNNSFHALKISFANEIGTLASRLKVDSEELFDIFLNDKNLNISTAYLRPGFSYGGSCLTKDLKGLNKMFLSQGVQNKLIESIEQSNQDHNNRFLELIEKINPQSVCFVGVTFKKKTDDLRFSGVIRLLEMMLGKPSYSKLKKVGVLEKETVQKKLKRRLSNQLSFVDSIEDALLNYELIVIGPYSLSKDERQALSSFSGKIVNLGFTSDKELVCKKADVYSVV